MKQQTLVGTFNKLKTAKCIIFRNKAFPSNTVRFISFDANKAVIVISEEK